MQIDREKILAKIRALLLKTTANGCTEAEAFAALDKASEMMDAYEVTPADLAELKADKPEIFTAARHDPHSIKAFLSKAVADFAGVRTWRNREGEIVFCGFRVDADLAQWLLDSLASFVQRELNNYLLSLRFEVKGQRRRHINGFVMGCAVRIRDRLAALAAQSVRNRTSNGRALVDAKGALIAAKLDELGLRFQRSTTRRKANGGAYQFGQSVGDRASFGRPVTGNASGVLRIGGH